MVKSLPLPVEVSIGARGRQSCAYTIAEVETWRGGSLDTKPRLARKFYTVVAVSMGLGLILNFVGLNAVAMLFWAAVVNGV